MSRSVHSKSCGFGLGANGVRVDRHSRTISASADLQSRRPRHTVLTFVRTRGDHGSHALCRYRRYRVYWPPRRVADPGPPRRRRGVGAGAAGVARPGSSGWPRDSWGDRAKPLVGDLTAPDLGLTDEAIAELGAVDHVVHCAAIYDITAAEDEQRAANVEGTRAVIDAGPAAGRDAAPRVVDRGRGHVPRRVHRGRLRRRPGPADALSPDQVRGRAAGALGAGAALPGLPARGGRRRLAHRRDGQGRRAVLLLRPAGQAGRGCPGSRRWCCPTPAAPTSCRSTSWSTPSSHSCTPTGRDGQTFHLTAPKTIGLRGIYRGVAKAAGLPPLRGSLPRAAATPILRATGRAKVLRNMAATQLGVPAEILDVVDLAPTFTSDNTEEALRGTGIAVPEFASYAPQLWRYWAEHLDPDRARRDDPAGPLVGKHVIITGASSGIGRASAIAVAERGATVFALARNAEALDELVAEIRAAGGQAHAFTCDVTDSTSVEHTVKDILGRFGHVDYLVNNAGRSIRRSVIASTDRLHDYERVMAVNYFGAVRMVLALLPHWRERRFGHVVNVSSAGVQASSPKYSAYIPSKAALDAFAEVVGDRDAVGPHHVHHHPHAAGEDADDRAVAPAQPDAADHRRARRGDGGARPGGQARAHRHPGRDAGRRRHVLHPEAVPARAAPALPRLSRFGGRPRRGTDEPRPASRTPRRPKRPARAVAVAARCPGPVKRAVRLVPGVHW